MTWNLGFTEALERSQPVAYAVRVEPLVLGDGVGERNYVVATANLAEWSPPVTETSAFIVAGSVRGITSSVSPQNWTPTAGGYTFRIAGDLKVPAWALCRGAIVGLYVAIGNGGRVYVQRVHIGMVTMIEGANEGGAGAGYDSISVTVVDIRAALGRRLGAAVGDGALFNTAGNVMELTGNEAVGSASYDVDSTTALSLPPTGNGAVYVQTSVGGDGYWRLVSAKGATTLTIDTPLTTPRMGTADVGASTGDLVIGGYYVSGHPFDVVRKILTSTGTRTNGTYDTLAESWGLGVPSDWIDDIDINEWRDEVLQPASGSYAWEIAGVTLESDAYSWLSALLSSAGMWITCRQGMITLRAVQPAYGAQVSSGITLTESDLVSTPSVHWYDPAMSTEYENVQVFANSTNAYETSGAVTTYPAEPVLLYDFSDRLFNNLSAVVTAEAARLRESTVDIWMRVNAVCAGLRCAGLAVGDLVDLSWPTIFNPWDPRRGLNGYRAHVLGIGVDWSAGTVTLSLGVPPKDTDE